MSVALVRVAQRFEPEERYFLDLLAGGFKGAVRLAKSNPEMAGDFCATNRQAIVKALEQLVEELGRLRDLLGGDADELRPALEEASDLVRRWTAPPRVDRAAPSP
jgi:prephenate dehydrogenase